MFENIAHSIKNQVNKLKPVSLDLECEKATKILRSFTFPELNSKKIENNIPTDIIRDAKGIAILTVGKAGMGFSIKQGSGVLLSRLEDNSWSAPSAIKTTGIGIGHLIGAEIIDLVLVMNTKEAVNSFNEKDNITLGGSMSMAVGPVGRNMEASSSVKAMSAIYSYCKSKGAYIGMSLDGSIIEPCKEINEAVYGLGVTQSVILSGAVPRPKFAEYLYQAIYECEFPPHRAGIPSPGAGTSNKGGSSEKSGYGYGYAPNNHVYGSGNFYGNLSGGYPNNLPPPAYAPPPTYEENNNIYNYNYNQQQQPQQPQPQQQQSSPNPFSDPPSSPQPPTLPPRPEKK